MLADKWQGKRFNSPNDAVVKSDNSIWFTDPAYGIDTDYEGDRQKQEIDGCHVYRIDPKSGAVDRVVSDMVRPNGIAFSPDEKLPLRRRHRRDARRERAAPYPPLHGRAPTARA